VLVPIILANAPGSERRAADPPDQRRPVTCRIASIIQAAGIWKIGVRLPLLQGVTFTAVSPMIAIGLAAGGGTDGLLSIYGPVIVAGLFTLLIAPYFARLIRFFPSVVTGTVILILGIALLPVAAGDIVQSFGPQDMQGEPVYRQIDGEFVLKDAVALKDIGYALGTLILIVLIQRFFKGFMQTVAVLIGLVWGPWWPGRWGTRTSTRSPRPTWSATPRRSSSGADVQHHGHPVDDDRDDHHRGRDHR
jgi:xanthine/uracil permease